METRRLQLLLDLSRLGSMRAVADEMGITTSTVSQQIAALAKETGAVLLEPDGRRVRLTPAGRRLAEHAVVILAAVDAARLDLDPAADPTGTLRVAGFATAVRRALLPIVETLAGSTPNVRLLIHEHEPAEAFELLATDDIDLALTYDFNLAPAHFVDTVEWRPLWSTPWSLGVPATAVVPADGSPEVVGTFRDVDWIVNSRNTADEEVIRTIAAMAGFEPRISHRVDSLELVQDLVVAGFGVGLLPADQPVRPGVALLALSGPDVRLRAYAVTRRGRATWSPLALVLDLLAGR
ncbi:LysR family transcriptional regulator [Pseudonocardia sp. TRM90224]|uniref:LysR family transcriptional regulator n=1 Tax=Pseudonocardia sp. TRM90224 TaxID=2812678 RepID=UPI001E3CBFDE|nr:LysR family transcriptional regulator [Pseudonocardia sp. TRM90224]